MTTLQNLQTDRYIYFSQEPGRDFELFTSTDCSLLLKKAYVAGLKHPDAAITVTDKDTSTILFFREEGQGGPVRMPVPIRRN